jgi:uncharacterized membrane protein
VDWLAALFLVLHVGGAILGFGPTITFPIIGAMGGKEPMHVNFSLRVAETISVRIVEPLALFQAVTGVLLIWKLGIDVFAHVWLLLGIVLYVIALVIVFTNQLPVARKLIEMTKNPPPPPAPGTAPSGPPPQLVALVNRSRIGGMVLLTLLVVIIILMVLGANGFIG